MAQPTGEDLTTVTLMKMAAAARSSSLVPTGAEVGRKLRSIVFRAGAMARPRKPA
jgi:hypothetical protein